ncbi:MAG TPA: glycosyl hydrolase family 28-related protein, partial [Verrucomicrobiae bacterium]|nr:glycosyl hydrolase family 28-related protein [Verrucomicrobiae bacterium]
MKTFTLCLVSCLMLSGCVGATTNTARVFNVRDYGAKGDGVTLDTAAIQKTIDTAAAAGGGTVLVPAGKFVIMPIVLASNINLKIA